MGIRNWRNCLVALLSVAAAWTAPSAQAMLMGGTFSNIGLSGDFTYDPSMMVDVTNESFSDWTFTAITAFNATYVENGMEESWSLVDFYPITPAITTANANGDSAYVVLATDSIGTHAILSTYMGQLNFANFINSNGYSLTLAAISSDCDSSSLCLERTIYQIYDTTPVQIAQGDYHINVPEPTTLALLSLGLAGLGFTRRRMKE